AIAATVATAIAAHAQPRPPASERTPNTLGPTAEPRPLPSWIVPLADPGAETLRTTVMSSRAGQVQAATSASTTPTTTITRQNTPAPSAASRPTTPAATRVSVTLASSIITSSGFTSAAGRASR